MRLDGDCRPSEGYVYIKSLRFNKSFGDNYKGLIYLDIDSIEVLATTIFFDFNSTTIELGFI